MAVEFQHGLLYYIIDLHNTVHSCWMEVTHMRRWKGLEDYKGGVVVCDDESGIIDTLKM